MAIISSCCFWKSLKKGCYASVLYTFVSLFSSFACDSAQMSWLACEGKCFVQTKEFLESETLRGENSEAKMFSQTCIVQFMCICSYISPCRASASRTTSTKSVITWREKLRIQAAYRFWKLHHVSLHFGFLELRGMCGGIKSYLINANSNSVCAVQYDVSAVRHTRDDFIGPRLYRPQKGPARISRTLDPRNGPRHFRWRFVFYICGDLWQP